MRTRRRPGAICPVKNLDFIVLGRLRLTPARGCQGPAVSRRPGRQAALRLGELVHRGRHRRPDELDCASSARLLRPVRLPLSPRSRRWSVPADTPDLWTLREQRYLLRAVPLEEYRRKMRSAARNGVRCGCRRGLSGLARPFRYFSHELPMEVERAMARSRLAISSRAFACPCGGPAKPASSCAGGR